MWACRSCVSARNGSVVVPCTRSSVAGASTSQKQTRLSGRLSASTSRSSSSSCAPTPTLLPAAPIQVGGAVITSTQIMVLGVTAISLAVLMYLVNYTRLGRAMRATAENPRVAALMGVRPDMVISATFIIGAVLAAIAGVMYASNYGTVQHTMGFLPGLKAFTAAVFGGIGNLAGAVVGGILLGLIESIGSGYIGALTGGVLGSHYSDIFAFVVLIIMLTLRPSGLLGERVADRA